MINGRTRFTTGFQTYRVVTFAAFKYVAISSRADTLTPSVTCLLLYFCVCQNAVLLSSTIDDQKDLLLSAKNETLGVYRKFL